MVVGANWPEDFQQGQLNVFESEVGGGGGAKCLLTKETPPWQLGPTGQKMFEKLISQTG